MQANLHKVTAMAALVLAGAGLSWGQAITHHTRPSGDHSPPMGIPLAQPPHAWLTARWTGNNKPFDTATWGIYRRVQREGPKRVYDGELAAARQRPLDLLAQFRWLYASTQLAENTSVIDRNAEDAVARLDPGTFRAVARVRYDARMMAGDGGSQPGIDVIGERLIAVDPHDVWTRSHLIADLANGHTTLPKAASLADQWVASEPKSPEAHGARAYVAQSQWLWSHNSDKAAAARTVKEYQAYLRLAPASDPHRSDATHMVKAVSKMAGLPVPRL